MRLNRTVFTLLAAASALSASTIFTLGSDHSQNYHGEAVGPYYGSLTGSTDSMFFCLDENLPSNWSTSYSGTLSTPTTEAEKEAAFLASYSLSMGAPGSGASTVNNVEGPVSMAIWQIMGTMNTPIDPNAQSLVAMAQSAYAHGQITSSFLSHVEIFRPDNAGIQRFITAYNDNANLGAVPEPPTVLLFGGSLVLFAIGGKRLRGLRARTLASRARA